MKKMKLILLLALFNALACTTTKEEGKTLQDSEEDCGCDEVDTTATGD